MTATEINPIIPVMVLHDGLIDVANVAAQDTGVRSEVSTSLDGLTKLA